MDGHHTGIPATLEHLAVDICALRPHPRNYKTHPPDQIIHLAESIREHGLYRNIITARDGTILAGHGVVQAAHHLGLERVPVVRLDLDPDEPRALKVLAGDNEVMHLGEVDDRALADLLKEIKETDIDGLLGTGYDEMMLANLALVTRSKAEIADFNEAAEWVGMPEYAQDDERCKLIITFASPSDRDDFAAAAAPIGLRIDKHESGTWTTRYPWTERDDTSHVKVEG